MLNDLIGQRRSMRLRRPPAQESSRRFLFCSPTVDRSTTADDILRGRQKHVIGLVEHRHGHGQRRLQSIRQ